MDWGMFAWGLVSIAMKFTQGLMSFYHLKFLLGLTEAGFFAGIIRYLSYRFPSNHRSTVTAMFMYAAPATRLIGSPISGALMQLIRVLSPMEWHWLFIAEGLFVLVLGLIILHFLSDRPADAC
jgi:ACS family tartrate transporter-like MFS transporter